MTDATKDTTPPGDYEGIQAWIAHALAVGYQADDLNGLDVDQVRELVQRGGKPPEPANPPKKRASSKARKAAAAVTEAAAAVVPEPASALTSEQRARVEALEVATAFLPFDVQNGITLCDVAEYVLSGLHPLSGAVIDADPPDPDPDPDDGGPGLTFASPTQTGATPHQTGVTA